MAKLTLPLTGTVSDGSRITIAERPIAHLTQLAGWAGFDAAAAAALAHIGAALPEDYRIPTVTPDTSVWRIAPDRVLVETTGPFAPAASDDLVALDLSDARICLRLTGPGAAALLVRVIALDLSEAAFPVGSFVQTGMHKIGTLIQRHETGFDVFLPITWSASVLSHWSHHLAA